MLIQSPDLPEKIQSPLRVLLIPNSEDGFDQWARALEKAGMDFSADRALTRAEFDRLTAESTYDAIVSDYSLDGWSGMDAFDALQSKGMDVPFIVVAGSIGEERAVACIKKGAADCVLKANLGALPWALRRAVEDRHIREQCKSAETSLRESEKTFRVLANSIASAVLIYQGTECRYANLTAQTLTGYSENELLGLSSWDLIHPDSHPLVIEQGFARLQGDKTESRNEIRILTKKGASAVARRNLGKDFD